MKQLLIHCDANRTSGFGHFSRCLALAELVRSSRPDIKVLFVGDYGGYAIDKLRLTNTRYIIIHEAESFTKEVINAFVSYETDFLLIDSYLAPQFFYDYMTEKEIKWGVFDDFAQQDFRQAQFVINFRVGAEKMFRYRSKTCGLGPGFMPIRAEFFAVRRGNEKRKVRVDVENILICLGGYDKYQVSGCLLESVIRVFDQAFVLVLLSDQDEISVLMSKYKNNTNVKVEQPCSDVGSIMGDMDLLVSGGGMLKYEAGYCGIPNAALSQTQEQHQDSLVLQEHGVLLDLGLAGDFIAPQVEKELLAFSRQSRQAMRARQLQIFPASARLQLVELIHKQLVV
ncbi:hypothetical protein A9Q82_03650 [Cycloclasticus sp. 46_120_T64]|nr:hypothetical protein A9Q82_03650 [Cycloclasticus sp. 46_120_T64]